MIWKGLSSNPDGGKGLTFLHTRPERPGGLSASCIMAIGLSLEEKAAGAWC